MAGPPSGLQGETERLAEQGRPLPEPATPGPPSSGTLPANQGLWVVPNFESFASIWNTVSRTYRYTADEALRHSRQNALAYKRDLIVYDALRARQRPVAGLEWHLEPSNEDDPLDLEHANRCRSAILETPNLQQLLMYLSDALWYGRQAAGLTYEWDWTAGYRRAIVSKHEPINGDKLVFRYSGELAILVGPYFRGSWIPTDRGRAHIYTPDERQTIILHQFEIEDADFYEGEMAGRIAGVGFRDRLYWFQYMKQRVFAWLMEFLERVGAGGLTVYYYETGNPQSLNEVKDAAEKQKNNNAILFPRYLDGKSGPGIERIEPSEAGAQFLFDLVTSYFDANIRRAILGQNLSAQSDPTGIGSGQAEFQEQTLADIVKYDARNLEESLTRDFVSTISRHIDPSRRRPRWKFDIDKPDAATHLQGAQAFFEMGGDIDEDDLRGVLGLRKPRPGAKILSRYGPMGEQGAMLQAQMQGVGIDQAGGQGGNQPGGISPTAQSVLPGNLIPGDPVASPQSNGNGGGRGMDLLQALFGGAI